eukprot:scaffold386_cov174-Ochromonas_danica.AAC.47
MKILTMLLPCFLLRRCLAMETIRITTPPGGLLSNMIYPIHESKAFSGNINIRSCERFLDNHSLLYEALLEDVHGEKNLIPTYLTEVYQTAQDFIHSDTIANRQHLLFTLNSLTTTSGQYWCLLGGKGSGKSALLKEFERKNCEKVFRIDMRQHKDILSGLIASLQSQYQYQEKSFLSWLTSLLQGFRVMFREYTQLSGKAVAQKVSDERNTLYFTLQQYIKQFGAFTIIIDEANIPFSKYCLKKEEQILEAQSILELFTALTKQDQKINVLLVSSDYHFPQALASDPIYFDLRNFSHYLFMQELSPADAWALLKSWNVRNKLAEMLLALYGGQVEDLYHGVQNLHLLVSSVSGDEEAIQQSCANYSPISGLTIQTVRHCLQQASSNKGVATILQEVLKKIIQEGQYQINRSTNDSQDMEEVINILQEHKLVYLRMQGHHNLFFGVEPAHNGEEILVPSKQSLRLAALLALRASN